MTADNLETEKNCDVLGGLEGERFVEALTALGSDLGQLRTFVANLSDAVEVGPKPIVSIGYEVDRDAVLISHLDKRLTDAMSQLVDLLAMTRVARATLAQAGVQTPG